jgi:hypothetical protein
MSEQTALARPDRTDLDAESTDKILAEPDSGRVPWVQPWGTEAAKAPLRHTEERRDWPPLPMSRSSWASSWPMAILASALTASRRTNPELYSTRLRVASKSFQQGIAARIADRLDQMDRVCDATIAQRSTRTALVCSTS